MSSQVDLSVVTITYNEKENIRDFVTDVEEVFRKNRLNGEIIVVDDSSPDGTGKIVDELAKEFKNVILVTRKEKLGIGSAYGTGVYAARGNVVATMDTDMSHPPSTLYEMYTEALAGAVVYGSRFVESGTFHTAIYRRIGTTTLSIWNRRILKLGINDTSNGYIACKREILLGLVRYARTQGVEIFSRVLYGVPIAHTAKINGIPLKEVIAPYRFREKGKTKIGVIFGLEIVLFNFCYSIWLKAKIKAMAPKSN